MLMQKTCGYSLVEILVALGITSFVILAAANLFRYSANTYAAQKARRLNLEMLDQYSALINKPATQRATINAGLNPGLRHHISFALPDSGSTGSDGLEIWHELNVYRENGSLAVPSAGRLFKKNGTKTTILSQAFWSVRAEWAALKNNSYKLRLTIKNLKDIVDQQRLPDRVAEFYDSSQQGQCIDIHMSGMPIRSGYCYGHQCPGFWQYRFGFGGIPSMTRLSSTTVTCPTGTKISSVRINPGCMASYQSAFLLDDQSGKCEQFDGLGVSGNQGCKVYEDAKAGEGEHGIRGCIATCCR